MVIFGTTNGYSKEIRVENILTTRGKMIDFTPYHGRLVYLRVKGNAKDMEGKLEFKRNQDTIVLKSSNTIEGESDPREYTIAVNEVEYIGYLQEDPNGFK